MDWAVADESDDTLVFLPLCNDVDGTLVFPPLRDDERVTTDLGCSPTTRSDMYILMHTHILNVHTS